LIGDKVFRAAYTGPGFDAYSNCFLGEYSIHEAVVVNVGRKYFKIALPEQDKSRYLITSGLERSPNPLAPDKISVFPTPELAETWIKDCMIVFVLKQLKYFFGIEIPIQKAREIGIEKLRVVAHVLTGRSSDSAGVQPGKNFSCR
jgi:hypothetical protein